MKLKWLAGMVLVVGLGGCALQESKPVETSETEAAEEDKAVTGTLLIYVEQEAGAGSFTTRMYVTEDYLHISDSLSPANFILFNRKEQTIYNVTQDDHTIFVIRPKAVSVAPPIEINYREESQPSSAIPKIDGRQATHYRYFANDTHCYDTVALPEDFMPDVVSALREFRTVLAGEHATTVNSMPADTQDACDLALNIFEATRHMAHGLPIREWDRKGYQRFMKDYHTEVEAPEGIFVLPADFKRYSVGDVLVGNGD
jgi:outer membrane lipoprotein-sorting protein